jgi:hypothetical protein
MTSGWGGWRAKNGLDDLDVSPQGSSFSKELPSSPCFLFEPGEGAGSSSSLRTRMGQSEGYIIELEIGITSRAREWFCSTQGITILLDGCQAHFLIKARVLSHHCSLWREARMDEISSRESERPDCTRNMTRQLRVASSKKASWPSGFSKRFAEERAGSEIWLQQAKQGDNLLRHLPSW